MFTLHKFAELLITQICKTVRDNHTDNNNTNSHVNDFK